ncbi:pyrimidine operon attenuation protein/uracil phosphoribosyltransferase [Methylomarinovum caldicuralii]|uniref:Pyrimidine operon attenuation protein/uracil phosphoribosyltransferase n=1 Tax=Methylomarinovum caldicuralii TaxID=438856 RepID=A0AAU9C638_9GAMM|nr:bifunctional pyr operon transcriptional regulator/uracil phosphoribosyltransferase PyrR [Methylomarinovum caldicuralii]BCX81389.1 pyrimidine operon attenuation protein/uracil phosphoribosyltransferase [Methylomarinovum caldicuralii]
MNAEALDIDTLLQNLADCLRRQIETRRLRDPLLVGIHTGGVWIAERLRERLGIETPLGRLNIAFYRDDFSRIGMHPEVRPSQLPSTENRDVILIDDVLYTGRTIRAALNELFDYGRPRQVILGVLIERDGRELPIQPDCVGGRVSLGPDQRIKLTGPDPLKLEIHTVEAP